MVAAVRERERRRVRKFIKKAPLASKLGAKIRR
jgi:hypothetical protein